MTLNQFQQELAGEGYGVDVRQVVKHCTSINAARTAIIAVIQDLPHYLQLPYKKALELLG